MNDARTQRERHADLSERFDRAQVPPGDCSSAVLLTTTTLTTYPTAAASFFACNPTDAGGTEIEGGAASYVTGVQIVFALNVGTQVPPAGTRVIAHGVGGRWVFRYDG